MDKFNGTQSLGHCKKNKTKHYIDFFIIVLLFLLVLLVLLGEFKN